MERSQLACKPTFRDVGVRQYREQTRTHHHWIHRRTEKGKCRQCGKVSNVIHAIIDLNCTLSMSNYYPHGALGKFVVTQKKMKMGKLCSNLNIHEVLTIAIEAFRYHGVNEN